MNTAATCCSDPQSACSNCPDTATCMRTPIPEAAIEAAYWGLPQKACQFIDKHALRAILEAAARTCTQRRTKPGRTS